MTSLGEGRLERLNALFREILPANPFQRARIGNGFRCESEADFLALPFLTKKELAADFKAHPPFGTNLTFPLES